MKLIANLIISSAIVLASTVPVEAKEVSFNMMRGMEEVQKGNKSAAMEYFNKDLAENPKNGYAYFSIALLQFESDDYGAARNSIEKAMQNISKKDKKVLSSAHVLRGELLGVEKDTAGYYSELATAIKLQPDNEDAYEKRGQLYYDQQRYDEGDADYRKLLELNPGGVMGGMGLGRNAHARKDYDKAIEHYSRILTLNPDYAWGYSFRAESYLAKEDYLKAIDDICKALEISSDRKAHYLLSQFPKEKMPLVIAKLKALSAQNPHTGEYDYYIAQLYSINRKFKESNEILEKAYGKEAAGVFIELISDNYSEMGDYKAALHYIDRAIESDPDDLNLIQKRADILGESGNIDGAIEEWGKIIEKLPDFGGAYYRRGFFEDNSNRTEAALADYEMAISLDPNYAYAYLGKGDMLKKLDRQEEALEAYRKVVELDTVPKFNSCAMYALLELGKRDEAVAFMDKVIALDETDPGNYYDAACFTCRLGDNNKALDYLKTAFEKGFRRLDHILRDDDLDGLRSMPEFENLIEEYKSGITGTKEEENVKTGPAQTVTEDVEIPFTRLGGVNEVSCRINDLPLKFIFDTGASDVSLSMVEANFMMKNGYLKRSDVIGTDRFYDANGDISEGTVINLRQIDFGGVKLDNVRASVVRNQKAPLLLGQSVLSRLGKIEIDNQNKKIIIKPL